jgi:hypothetical protein
MNFLKSMIADLRARRLWPIAAGLLVAIVAVPVLLASGSKSGGTAPRLPGTTQLAPPAGVPVVSTGQSPTGGRISGSSRDPFTQLAHGNSATTGTSSTASTSAAGTSAGAATSTASSPSAGGSSTTPASTGGPGGAGTTPSSIVPSTKPKPAPRGLTSTQSYEVKLAITNPSGGLDTIDPLERLTVLPGDSRPLLVELGVLKGGSRVLFAVQPGAVVGGPGTCIPAPIDCEILSMAQDQTESLSAQSSSAASQVALFAVTGITAAGHSSVAAANKAREAQSAAGRRLLEESDSSVLPLFRYDPRIGAVVDDRSLVIR